MTSSDAPRRLPLGKLPPTPNKPALTLTRHLRPIAKPTKKDWLSHVPTWPMYANDQYGDCVWAMIGHAIKAWTTYASTPVEVAEGDVLRAYAEVTGFNPSDPATDQGTVMQDALSHWRTTGVAGHKILAFARVDHTSTSEMHAAISVFGALLVGIEFPAVAMQQFDANQPWSAVRSDGGIEGGHAVHVGAFGSPRGAYQATTWGRVQTMTGRFATRYIDEAWVAITREWLDAAGRTPDGLDLRGLGQEFTHLTGKPDPFTSGV